MASCCAVLSTGARLSELGQWADGTAPGLHAPFINTPSRSPEGSRNMKSNIKSKESLSTSWRLAASCTPQITAVCTIQHTRRIHARSGCVPVAYSNHTHHRILPRKDSMLVLCSCWMWLRREGAIAFYVMKYASLLLYRAPISFVTHRWMKALHVLRRPAERRHMQFCQNQWKCAVLMGICVFNSISLCCLDSSSKTALEKHSCCFEW